jgi:glycosyltransferase involved in cell wall biosynthesis
LPRADYTIIIASAIPWQASRHRQHEVARLLSERCAVLFIEPLPARHLNAAPRSPARPLEPSGLEVEPVTPTLTVVRPRRGLWRGWSASQTINARNRREVARQLRLQFPALAATQTILWLGEAAAEACRGQFGERLVVYDIADEAWAFSRNPLRRRLLKACETRLSRAADLIFASSEPLYQDKLRLNPHTHLAANAVDYDHFARATHPPPDAPVIIGFTGATLLKRTDYDLLSYLAAQRPHWRLELVGPTQWPRRLPCPANLDLLGSRPYADLPALMSRHHVCLIPYHPTGELAYIHPKKLFEYLAAGKPIVATDMPTLRPYEGLVKIARTPAEFLGQIEACLAENRDPARSAALIEERRALARRHTWRALVADMVEIMEAALSEEKSL